MVAGSGRLVSPCDATSSATRTGEGAAVAEHVVMLAQVPGAQGKRQPSDVPVASHPRGLWAPALSENAPTDDARSDPAVACMPCISWPIGRCASLRPPCIEHNVPLASSVSCRRRTLDNAAMVRRTKGMISTDRSMDFGTQPRHCTGNGSRSRCARCSGKNLQRREANLHATLETGSPQQLGVDRDYDRAR